ncbi:TFIIE alpha subunit-domain-containing protein [Suillus plorans]|uniref:TFIIE alpha subunit-domain-containing protein n=1 Tax=Suillus plorans TaxID=116603 RepID=A0A9P7AD31_9AGAM|nr:TFIIE alpha subunit-domain-containing protein [Suillus plorans]KAG1786838.1 TFIIE alpha subunit-domain-containing protein [Suillus plorans]
MATKEDQESLRLLVQHVSRGFYEPKFTIIMDQLARHPVLKDDDLAGRMGLQAKELNKLMAVLGNDRLVQVYRQNELKEGAQRSVGRQYYYIDYKHFCDVVKWRIAEMRRIIDSGLRNELDNKGYICPQCSKSYTTLEVDKLMDFSRGIFVCEDCRAEVVENENAENVRGSQDRMQRFNHQMRFVVEGLRKTESMVLPALDVPTWVKNNVGDVEKQKTGQVSGLKIAGSGPGGRQEDGVGIVMSMDKDEATRRQERDAEAAAKRQQNALPAWHLKSTITGDLTALGMQESARAVAREGEGLPVSSDDALKGLGTIGTQPRLLQLTAVTEDVKPEINQEMDYCDQYYASLAASNAVSSQNTPRSGLGSEELEEDDQKPSVQYLDSLNDYRKRSRSKEDEGAAATKLPKIDVPELEPDITDSMMEVNGADDTPVLVNGVLKPFSEVTDEDTELMTPDEYTAYYEVLQSRS